MIINHNMQIEITSLKKRINQLEEENRKLKETIELQDNLIKLDMTTIGLLCSDVYLVD